MLLGIFFETFGLALLFPVLEVVGNPEIIQNYQIGRKLLEIEFFNHTKNLVTTLTIFVIVIYILKSVFLTYLYWFQSKFSSKLGESIATNLLLNYLEKPYAFHLNKNSAELQRNIKVEVLQFTEVIKSGLTLILEIFVILCVGILLFYIEPLGAIVLTISFGILMLLFSKLTNKKLAEWGQIRQKVSNATTKTINHAFGGIKDIKILEVQDYFIQEFRNKNALDVNIQTRMSTLGLLPRILLEFIAVSGLMLFILIVSVRGGDMTKVIPTIGIFLAAAFRTIPSINRIIGAKQFLDFSKPVVNLLHREFNNFNQNLVKDNINPNFNPNFKTLELINIDFQYNEASELILKNINLKINKLDVIGIIGESGAGKSTLIDIILGINTPTNGKIIYNNNDIVKNLYQWHKQIGYIQQSVFLIDDSLLKNIAFGVNDDLIDLDKVNYALNQSQLFDFVKSLPYGLNTIVGERGVRISGGQKQRIGIARALYNNPSILVFDEATSNLDINTENAIMSSISLLSQTKTIIIIAHRKSALTKCNRIFEIKGGFLTEVDKSLYFNSK
jgi:ABC-type bacteriocin/lantibiotic exporter with double-glycine peptidase domain